MPNDPDLMFSHQNTIRDDLVILSDEVLVVQDELAEQVDRRLSDHRRRVLPSTLQNFLSSSPTVTANNRRC